LEPRREPPDTTLLREAVCHAPPLSRERHTASKIASGPHGCRCLLDTNGWRTMPFHRYHADSSTARCFWTHRTLFEFPGRQRRKRRTSRLAREGVFFWICEGRGKYALQGPPVLLPPTSDRPHPALKLVNEILTRSVVNGRMVGCNSSRLAYGSDAMLVVASPGPSDTTLSSLFSFPRGTGQPQGGYKRLTL